MGWGGWWWGGEGDGTVVWLHPVWAPQVVRAVLCVRLENLGLTITYPHNMGLLGGVDDTEQCDWHYEINKPQQSVNHKRSNKKQDLKLLTRIEKQDLR